MNHAGLQPFNFEVQVESARKAHTSFKWLSATVTAVQVLAARDKEKK